MVFIETAEEVDRPLASDIIGDHNMPNGDAFQDGSKDVVRIHIAIQLLVSVEVKRGKGGSVPLASLQISNAIFLNQGMTRTYTSDDSRSDVSF